MERSSESFHVFSLAFLFRDTLTLIWFFLSFFYFLISGKNIAENQANIKLVNDLEIEFILYLITCMNTSEMT